MNSFDVLPHNHFSTV